MDLDRAMLLLGEALGANVARADLTEQVRLRLLAALAGEKVVGLSVADQDALNAWLQHLQAADPDSGAALYQQMLARVVEWSDEGLAVRKDRKAHRATGAYYTGGAVVRYMARRAREFLPGAVSLVDPACGAGAFLAGARDAFGGQLTRLIGLDADPLALNLCRQHIPEAGVHQLDALLEEFPGGYDLCLGNPPYISTGLRGASNPDAERLAALRRRFPQTAQYKLNTYPLFIERGLELLRPGGVLGYILPDSFLSGRYFAGVRRLLLGHTLLELTLVCEDFWEHGRVGQSVILVVRKGPAPPGHTVTVKVCRSVEDLEHAPAVQIPLSELVWGSLHRFRLIPDSGLRELVRAMDSCPGSHPLGTYLRTYSGLIGRQGQGSLLRSQHPERSGPWGRLLRSGREIDRYHLDWAGAEVCLDPGLIKSGGHLAYYQAPKLLLRQTADSLRAVYDDRGFYCFNNIHLLAPRSGGTDLYLMLGLINSAVLDRYYRAMTMETGRLYAQVDLDLLESIPVPPVPSPVAARLSFLVQERQHTASQEAACLERGIDQLVSACYGLPD